MFSSSKEVTNIGQNQNCPMFACLFLKDRFSLSSGGHKLRGVVSQRRVFDNRRFPLALGAASKAILCGASPYA
jgi:hypothetical protein